MQTMKESKYKPLLMSFAQLEKTLLPYCYGKKVTIQGIKDIWASATPIPNSNRRIILPKHFMDFIQIAVKENA